MTKRQEPRTATAADSQSLPRDLGTKEAILEAALECFARFGFEGTSMSAVARTAGVTQPLMHYYFSSKDELWRAAVTRAFDEMLVQQELGNDLEELDPVSALKVLIRRFIMFHSRHPLLGPLIASEAPHMTARLMWLSDEYLAPLERHMGEILHRAQQIGQIRADLPVPYMVRFIVGGAGGFFTTEAQMRRIYNIDTSDPAAIKTHANVVFELLFGGLLSSTASTASASPPA
jgi:AcrR family transcriptional regulator